MAVVEVEKLTKIYVRDFLDVEHGRLKLRLAGRKTVALDHLTMQVQQGEIFGLLGPNGAGKTTTLKILMGIHFPTAGRARILGRPLGDLHVKRRIGFLPENPYFYDYLRGWEFLDFYGQLYGMARAARRKKIEELLTRVGLEHAANLPLRGYSKGMNQRIGLAQSLLNDPDLVFLDEPQSGLDPLGRKDIRDLIISLRAQGKTVLFSSHILQDAELICDRVAILDKGQLKAIGHLAELLSGTVRSWEIVFRGLSAERIEAWRPRMRNLVESKGDYLAILEEKGGVDELIRETLAQGGEVISLTPHRQTLEEYFVSEVGGKGA